MDLDAIVRSMRSTSDEELLAITSGAAMGYTDEARAIAEAVLRERRVQLPADLKELRKRAAIAEDEANRRAGDSNAALDKGVAQKVSSKILLLAIGAFALSLVGLQVDLLKRIGTAISFAIAVFAGAEYMALRPGGGKSETPPQDEP